MMKFDRALKNAFLDGLAAPVSLYSGPGAYVGAAAIPGPAQSFAMVGNRLTATLGVAQDNEVAAIASRKITESQ